MKNAFLVVVTAVCIFCGGITASANPLTDAITANNQAEVENIITKAYPRERSLLLFSKDDKGLTPVELAESKGYIEVASTIQFHMDSLIRYMKSDGPKTRG